MFGDSISFLGFQFYFTTVFRVMKKLH